jgi:hypothetical protein
VASLFLLAVVSAQQSATSPCKDNMSIVKVRHEYIFFFLGDLINGMAVRHTSMVA